MYYTVVVLIMLVAVFLILFVLMQKSKGSGVSATFGGNNQVMGVKKTSDLLERITWGLAIALMALSALTTTLVDKSDQNDRIKSINERMMDDNGGASSSQQENKTNQEEGN
jgi:preprotein translocase subunit SecG